MFKIDMSELNFYLSRTIGHRFWRTLNMAAATSGECQRIKFDIFCVIPQYLSPTLGLCHSVYNTLSD